MVSIIAEAGINHGGSLDTACVLAAVAKDAGCDYVKLQKRDPEWSYSTEELARPCESPWGETIGDKVRGRELSWRDLHDFDAHCRDAGIEWFASCFDLSALRMLHDQFPKRSLNKVPSCLATRSEYLREVAAQRIPTLVSTGHFATVREAVTRVAAVFIPARCRFGLLHTTALYPAQPDRLNLRRIAGLHAAAEALDCGDLYMGTGYSGHETGVSTSVVAAALGARWIERHVTLDRASYGADQAASLEPEGLRRLVRDVRVMGAALGDPDPILQGDEKMPVTYWRSR